MKAAYFPPFFLFSILTACHLNSSAQSPKIPFPHHTAYVAGILPDGAHSPALDTLVGQFFRGWVGEYLKPSPDGKGEYIYTRGPHKDDDCVSEAMGYGMLILALMADSANSVQNRRQFDSLYMYVRAHPSVRDRPGTEDKVSSILMASAQSIKSSMMLDTDNTSAADGDIDIAFALLLAAKQWPEPMKWNYAEEADRMIDSILAQDIHPSRFTIVESNAIEQDGSADSNDLRTSDFIPSEFKAFARYRQEDRWARVVDSCYAVYCRLQKQLSPDAHLLADFYKWERGVYIAGRRDRDEKHPDAYYYNACRDPWRIGTDYLMTGEPNATKLIVPLADWIFSKAHGNIDQINAGYPLLVDGRSHLKKDYDMLSFVAPLGVAAMANPDDRPILNRIWKLVAEMPLLPSGKYEKLDYGYYENTIKLLCMIVMSGNYWEPNHQ